jgi:hypothetical protein
MGPGLETAIVGSSITTEQHATRAFPLYSPECVEGLFCEVGLPLNGVLGSSHTLGPTPMSVPGGDRLRSGTI